MCIWTYSRKVCAGTRGHEKIRKANSVSVSSGKKWKHLREKVVEKCMRSTSPRYAFAHSLACAVLAAVYRSMVRVFNFSSCCHWTVSILIIFSARIHPQQIKQRRRWRGQRCDGIPSYLLFVLASSTRWRKITASPVRNVCFCLRLMVFNRHRPNDYQQHQRSFCIIFRFIEWISFFMRLN